MAAASKRLLNETAPTGSNHVSLYGARNETYNSSCLCLESTNNAS